MLRIPIVTWKRRCAAAGEDDLGGKSLPASYMSEYSVLGFFVENVDNAVRVLQQGDACLERKAGTGEILVETAADVPKIAMLLQQHGVAVEIADVIDGIYQG